jgi:hypothetical protein
MNLGSNGKHTNHTTEATFSTHICTVEVC